MVEQETPWFRGFQHLTTSYGKEVINMKKELGKNQNRNQKSLQFYSIICVCGSTCSSCGSVPSSDYVNVRDNDGGLSAMLK